MEGIGCFIVAIIVVIGVAIANKFNKGSRGSGYGGDWG